MEHRKFDILMLLQIVFSIFVITISSYCIAVGKFTLLPLSFVFLSAIFIILGLREYKRTQKMVWSISFFVVALFVLFSALLNILYV